MTTVPVPANATVCGLAPPLSEKLRSAVFAPIVDGLNCTDTVQLAFPGTLLPHVLAAIKKSVAFVPARAMEEMFKIAEPRFVRVTVCDAFVVFTR